MTRKDYVVIARAVSNATREFGEEGVGDGGAFDGIDTVVDFLASALKQDNPRFDRERFIAACHAKGN